jgi:hypothetical protein
MRARQSLAFTFTVGTLLLIGAHYAEAQPPNATGAYYPPPAWSQTLSGSARFTVLANFGGAAVLDRETGVVWDRAPNVSTLLAWADARVACTESAVGGRRGWRLPSIHELAALLDPSVPGGPGIPRLPAGHPFTSVPVAGAWAATIDADDPTRAWSVVFGAGDVGSAPRTGPGGFYAWCVRGNMNADTY